MSYKRPRAASPSGNHKRPRGTEDAFKNVKLGTQLAPDDDGDAGSFVPVWKQTVTDERGRRRLHGAFTGGFSAGYFNTVGSKEGWTPKAFVSSRSARNKDQTKTAAQRPEDFMDDEDLAQAAEARQLEAASSFAGIGESSDASAMNDTFFGLFITEEETIGVKIVQRMGWKRDQGMGRKVRRPAQIDNSANDSEAISPQHLFAPKDARTMPMTQQNSRKGLGFHAEPSLVPEEEADTKGHPALGLTSLETSSHAPPSRKSMTTKTSFGVGILNDTGSDDEDPYELGPKISVNKTIGKDRKPKKPSKFVKPSVGRHVFRPRKTAQGSISSLSVLSRDGKPLLRGFTLAIRITIQQTRSKYPVPQIPPDWKSSKGSAPLEDSASFKSVADAAKSSTLDAGTRASLLGETPLPSKSVFDFISKENRDRIASLTGKADLPQGLGQSAPEGHRSEGQKDLWSFVPVLDKDVAIGALAKGATGWMPYAEDVKKRSRYVSFLELKAGKSHELPERAQGVSISDWMKEMEEFEHAAQVFKPTSGIMASRFTSAFSISVGNRHDIKSSDLLRAPVAKPDDPAEQAAKLGMYGAMTRSMSSFHPTRLLCKRFNVPPPKDVPLSADVDTDGEPKTQEAVSKTAMDTMLREVLIKGPALQRPTWMNQPKETAGTDPVNPRGHAVVDVEKNEALSKERAPEDVFRAIFGDSEDDEDEH